MNIFLDTSSLVKLYHRENETEELLQLVGGGKVDGIYLSTLSSVEYYSAIWKKVRIKEFTEKAGMEAIKMFEANFNNYNWIDDSDLLKAIAINMVSRYGKSHSIKTLDAIQLATAITLKPSVSLFKTSDKVLQQLFEAEGLPTK